MDSADTEAELRELRAQLSAVKLFAEMAIAHVLLTMPTDAERDDFTDRLQKRSAALSGMPDNLRGSLDPSRAEDGSREHTLVLGMVRGARALAGL